jgi:hypothetical protein
MRMLVLGDDGRYTLDRPFERWCVPESYGDPGIEWQGDDL